MDRPFVFPLQAFPRRKKGGRPEAMAYQRRPLHNHVPAGRAPQNSGDAADLSSPRGHISLPRTRLLFTPKRREADAAAKHS